ncbi:hypothetical protein [Enterovirga rhinocerotis]|uniref:Uncharacterized protein n=1 Tax=Enterovirga rhinocerotis TaxID=1339210 RepID=A0A4R7CAP4_9HYPH|nr:hypothetical protein [Enterovirga rhinocerotis]TDR94445.1 hypothetical protein EV668_1732 [Enterovirga rhinocerotis]
MGAAATAPQAEQRTDDARAWAGFARLLIGATIGLLLVGIAILLAIDPYDTGRTGFLRPGLNHQYPTTANASRARDPRFDSAVFGNSRMQQLQPARLDGLTGWSTVSLTIPGTRPADQFAVLRWFLDNHAAPRAIVMGADEFWCEAEPGHIPNFPTWLYAESFRDYLVGLVRYRAFEGAASRIAYLLTGKKGLRPDGYWDYRPMFANLGLADPDKPNAHLMSPRPGLVNETGRFPAFDRLRTVLATLPPETAFILVRPPTYRTAIPDAGSPAARTIAACVARAREVLAGRPRTALLDLQQPGAEADDPRSFYDPIHYRDSVAERIEAQIAEAYAAMPLGMPRERRSEGKKPVAN